jgi:ABC-type glutathione transport system ATPase component
MFSDVGRGDGDLLEVRDLAVHYPGGVTALDGVDLIVAPGELVGIAGESGCGKTTLAMAVPRLLPAGAVVTRGTICFDGVDVAGLDDAALRALRWRQVSVVLQGAMNALNPVLSIGHQIADRSACMSRRSTSGSGGAGWPSCSTRWASRPAGPGPTRTSSPAVCGSAS